MACDVGCSHAHDALFAQCCHHMVQPPRSKDRLRATQQQPLQSSKGGHVLEDTHKCHSEWQCFPGKKSGVASGCACQGLLADTKLMVTSTLKKSQLGKTLRLHCSLSRVSYGTAGPAPLLSAVGTRLSTSTFAAAQTSPACCRSQVQLRPEMLHTKITLFISVCQLVVEQSAPLSRIGCLNSNTHLLPPCG